MCTLWATLTSSTGAGRASPLGVRGAALSGDVDGNKLEEEDLGLRLYQAMVR